MSSRFRAESQFCILGQFLMKYERILKTLALIAKKKSIWLPATSWRLLILLSYFGPATTKDLAEQIDFSRSTIYAHLNFLGEFGYIDIDTTKRPRIHKLA